jgi:hypothetical protein
MYFRRVLIAQKEDEMPKIASTEELKEIQQTLFFTANDHATSGRGGVAVVMHTAKCFLHMCVEALETGEDPTEKAAKFAMKCSTDFHLSMALKEVDNG